MKAKLQALSTRFAALSRREQIIVAVAGLLAVGLGGFAIGVDPVRMRAATLQKQIAQQRQDAATLRDQLVVLKARLSGPEAERKKAMADIQADLAALDKEQKSHEEMLMPPQRMPQLLQSLLVRHRGLDLVGVRTLAPVPLIDRRKDANVKAEGVRTGEGGNVYKHGLEIAVAGSYAELLAYVTELEQSQQKLLWEKMALAVKEYPRSELTLTLYTLSLDPKWLVL